MSAFELADAPLLEMPRGTKEAREGLGLMTYGNEEGPLYPVEGGFISRNRKGDHFVVSKTGELRDLGLTFENVSGYPLRWSPLPTQISADAKRLLILDAGKLAVFEIADASKRSLGHAAIAAAWIDDDRAVVADGTTLDVVSTNDGKVLASAKLGAKPYQIILGARPDGVCAAAFGETPVNAGGGKPMKERAFEVYALGSGTLARVGKRAKAPFSIFVQRGGELYFVEASPTGPWRSNKRLVVS